MPELRCSFCFRKRNEAAKGVAGARVYICGDCIALAVEKLNCECTSSSPSTRALHPATEEFFRQFLAFREQLETDHQSSADHALWEKELEQLEELVQRLRARIVSNAEV